MAVNPIPEDHNRVSPYLIVQGAARLIDFLKQAFDGEELLRMALADGSIMHAEVKIVDSVVMIGDAGGEHAPAPGSLHLYVEDTDGVYQRALRAGAISRQEPADQRYGERTAAVTDPTGNVWWIAMRTVGLSAEELVTHAESVTR